MKTFSRPLQGGRASSAHRGYCINRNVIGKLVTTGRMANSFVKDLCLAACDLFTALWTHAINQPHGGLCHMTRALGSSLSIITDDCLSSLTNVLSL